jgi:hypothetical protein
MFGGAAQQPGMGVGIDESRHEYAVRYSLHGNRRMRRGQGGERPDRLDAAGANE